MFLYGLLSGFFKMIILLVPAIAVRVALPLHRSLVGNQQEGSSAKNQVFMVSHIVLICALLYIFGELGVFLGGVSVGLAGLSLALPKASRQYVRAWQWMGPGRRARALLRRGENLVTRRFLGNDAREVLEYRDRFELIAATLKEHGDEARAAAVTEVGEKLPEGEVAQMVATRHFLEQQIAQLKRQGAEEAGHALYATLMRTRAELGEVEDKLKTFRSVVEKLECFAANSGGNLLAEQNTGNGLNGSKSGDNGKEELSIDEVLAKLA
jgi:hypothetical protein